MTGITNQLTGFFMMGILSNDLIVQKFVTLAEIFKIKMLPSSKFKVMNKKLECCAVVIFLPILQPTISDYFTHTETQTHTHTHTHTLAIWFPDVFRGFRNGTLASMC